MTVNVFIFSRIFLLQVISMLIVFGVLSNFSAGASAYSKISAVVGLSAFGALLALILKKSLLNLESYIQGLLILFLMILLTAYNSNHLLWIMSYILINVILHLSISSLQGEIENNSEEKMAEYNKTFHLGNTSGSVVGVTIAPLIGLNLSIKYIFIFALIVFLIFLTLNHYFKQMTKPPLNDSEWPVITSMKVANIENLPIYFMTLLIWISGGFFYVIEIPILKNRFNFNAIMISTVFFITTMASLIAIFLIKKISKKLTINILGYLTVLCLFFPMLYAGSYNSIAVFPLVLLYGFSNGCYNYTYSYLIQMNTSFESRTSIFLKIRISAQVGLLISSLLSLAIDIHTMLITLKIILAAGIITMFLIGRNLKKIKVLLFIPILFFSLEDIHAADSQLKVAISSLPKEINPSRIRDADSALIHNQIFERLYSLNDQNFIVPLLVKQSTWSPDLKKLTIMLKDEKFFSDGSPLGAEQVTSSLTRTIRDFGEDSRWAFGNIIGFNEFIKKNNLMKIKGINPSGESKVIFEFERPTPYFIKILTGPYFSIYKQTSKNIIGSGPYKLQSRPKEGVYLERNPMYKAKFEGPSKLHFISNKPGDEDINLTKETKNKELLKENFPYLQSVILIFNTLNPQFKNPKNRCDFAQEATVVFGQSTYNFTPVNIGLPLSWSIKRPFIIKTDTDLKNFNTISTEIVFTNSTAYFDEEKHAEITKALEKKGIKVSFKKLNTHEFIERMKTKKFKIALVGFVPDYVHPDAILTPLLGTSQQFNFSKYSNPILDKLLVDAKSSDDSKKQLELYNQAFDILSSECPVVFLGSQSGIIYRKRNLKIPSFSSLGFHNIDFSNVTGANRK